VVATIDEVKATEFYTVRGNALSSWQNAEQQLAFIFEKAAESRHAHIIFDAITSTRDKLFVLDALLQRRLHDHALLQDWIKLCKKISHLSRKRNAVVHGYPIKLPVAPVVLPINANTEFEYFVGPSSFTKSHLLIDPAQRSQKFRDVKQLKELAHAFDEPLPRMSEFSNALGRLLKLPKQPKRP
jgi:hypothetical protein